MVTAPPKPQDRALGLATEILDLASADWPACRRYVKDHVPNPHRSFSDGLITITGYRGLEFQVAEDGRHMGYRRVGRFDMDMLDGASETLALTLDRD